MNRRAAVCVIGAIAILLVVVPAHAGPARSAPKYLRCKASGSAVHFHTGGFSEIDAWNDIQASGRCLGDPVGPLNVTVTGSGQNDVTQFVLACFFNLDVQLTDSTGKHRLIRQVWNCDPLVRFIVLRRNVPIGLGTASLYPDHTHPTGDSDPVVIPISMSWKFVNPAWS
jgi:hypothetical protein